MAIFELSGTQKLHLEKRHGQTHDGRERDRIKAILLRAEGWQIDWIAQALRKHESSVSRYIDEYVVSQKTTLASGGSESKLSKAQTLALITHLTARTYHQQKDIVAYIKKTWDIDYSVPGINKWLHKNGFSYKKPKGLPYKADLNKQAAFITHYQQLKASLSENESLYFMDAVHPTQATKVSSGWIRTGTDKPIQTTGSRTRLNIVGALQLGRIEETITAQYDTVNQVAIVDFLQQLRDHHLGDGKIHLVLDGAGYHKAESVKEKSQALNIILHRLPPYSPNLNPIERLWKVMNEKVRNNQCFHSAKEFREKINHFFDDILPEIGGSLTSRINDNFQIFDHAFSS